ncbi:MAG: DNA adenine methylase [Proteobacteria bacterium]|nr:DNA adenine methylase [Pseudomonadota bacterium]MCP4919244.1 DNA adenine methylase [Pseudomonadota bacterium]
MQAVVAVTERVRALDTDLSPAKPFLKWAGGKRRVVPKLLEYLDGPMGRYHEPFVGGGALFFSLAQTAAEGHGWARLTDMNLRLVRAYRGIRDDLEGVLERLADFRDGHCEDHYYRVRANSVDDSEVDADVAAWMIYLNKTGFNGLYRVNKKGGFNVPIGRYENPNIRDEANLRAVSRVLADVEIEHADYGDVFYAAEKGDVVYFDPPYVPLTKTASFTAYTKGGFGLADQVKLRDIAWELKQRGVRVLLSNHDTPEVRDLYKDFEIEQILVKRAINSRSSGRGAVAEVVIS